MGDDERRRFVTEWGAKVGARCPWTTCVIHLSSYECGMDQPTYTPTQKIVEWLRSALDQAPTPDCANRVFMTPVLEERTWIGDIASLVPEGGTVSLRSDGRVRVDYPVGEKLAESFRAASGAKRASPAANRPSAPISVNAPASNRSASQAGVPRSSGKSLQRTRFSMRDLRRPSSRSAAVFQ